METQNVTLSPVEIAANPQQVWEECLAKIRNDVSTLSFKTWFQPIVPLRINGSELTVGVPSQFFYDWVEEHYNALMRKTIASVLGSEAKLFYSISREERLDAAHEVVERS